MSPEKKTTTKKKKPVKKQVAKEVKTPKLAPYADRNVFHIYAILVKNRDGLQKHLSDNGIQSGIHYPVPIQRTKPFKHLDYFKNENAIKFAEEMLSLPMHPFLTDEEIGYISKTINEFF